MKKNNNIALITDFGIDDIYVGVMKGVILTINPEASFIDLTHSVMPQNIRQASFLLKSSYKYFPKGTIFLCVVDPGVGSARKGLIIEAEGYYFVGPDNGIFSFLFNIANNQFIYELKNNRYISQNISNTFHGRDIFAPAAAYLSNGTDANKFGNKLEKKGLVSSGSPIFEANNNACEFEIQHIDRYGNIITSIPESYSFLNTEFVEIFNQSGKLINKFRIVNNYSEAKSGETIIYKGSYGFYELAVSMGSLLKEWNNDVDFKKFYIAK